MLQSQSRIQNIILTKWLPVKKHMERPAKNAEYTAKNKHLELVELI